MVLSFHCNAEITRSRRILDSRAFHQLSYGPGKAGKIVSGMSYLGQYQDLVRTSGIDPDCYSCCSADGFKTAVSELPENIRRQALEDPPEGPRPCICRGLNAAPGVEPSHVKAAIKMSLDYYAARPWLQLRMNHVLRLQIPWTPLPPNNTTEFFVQVLGGTGNCQPSLIVTSDIDEVEDERMFHGGKSVPTMRMLKVIFDKPQMSVETCRNLLYLMDIQVAFPRPNVESWNQDILPLFARCIAVRVEQPDHPTNPICSEWRMWQPTVKELAILHTAMAAVMFASERLEHVPGTPSGDYKAFYPMDPVEFPVRDSYIVFDAPSEAKAKVSFPYTHDATKLSPLQKIGVRPRGRLRPSQIDLPLNVDTSECSSQTILEQMDRCLRIKADGNLMFNQGKNREAFDKYTEALAEFPEKETMRDDGVLREWETIKSNRAQAAYRMGDHEVCIQDASDVVGYPAACENKHHVRSLFARARAYKEMNQIDDAIDDFQVLYSALLRMKELKKAKTVQTTLRNLKREQRDTVSGTVTWRKVPGEGGTLPTPRCLHTAVCWQGQLYVYGGIPHTDSALTLEPKDFSTDIWILDLATNEWVCKKTIGNGPRVSRHTSTLHGGRMYVFGGEGPVSSSPESDMYRLSILNLKTLKWEVIRGRNQPRARIEHSAVAYKGRMYVFGGSYVDRKDDIPESDVLLSMSFTNYKWRREPTVGDVPPMLGCAMACVHRDCFVVHGGQKPKGRKQLRHYTPLYSSDLYFYDLEGQAWRKVDRVDGHWPRCRAETEAISFVNRSIYIHGGYSETSNGGQFHGDTLRLYTKGKSMEWQRCIAPQEATPGPRAGCSITVIENQNRAILVGGYNMMRRDGQSEENFYREFKIPYNDAWELFLSKKSNVEVALEACGHCGKEGKWKKCRGCKIARYCSPPCQEAEWESHKKDCSWTRADADRLKLKLRARSRLKCTI